MRKDKTLLVILMTVLLCLGSFTVSSEHIEAASSEPRIYVDGNKFSFSSHPAIIENGVTLVPAREFSEKLGAKVTYDGKTKKIVIDKSDTKITLTIDSNYAYVNKTKVKLDYPVVVRKGHTLLPLRFVSESLGGKVGYDASTNSVHVDSYEFRRAQLLILSTLSYSLVDGYYGGFVRKDGSISPGTKLSDMLLKDEGSWGINKFGDLRSKLKTLEKRGVLKKLNGKSTLEANPTIADVFSNFSMKDWSIYTYLDGNDAKNADASGFFGAVFYNSKTGDFVYTIRGTKKLDDWVYNTTIPKTNNSNETSQVKFAKQLLSKIPVLGKDNSKITIVGHSLGGYLTDILSIQNNIKGVAFNAPGLNSGDAVYKTYKNNTTYVEDYTIKGDPVSEVGIFIGTSKPAFINTRESVTKYKDVNFIRHHGIVNFFDHLLIKKN